MLPATRERLSFDVYGLRIAVAGEWPEVIEAIGLDFAWFAAPERSARGDVEIVIERRPPDFAAFGEVEASFVTPRNVVYQQRGRSIVDYFGRALSIYDRARGRLVVQGQDAALVHEAAYHFILSRSGEHLERRGLVRLHALGLATAAGAVAVLLPSGGGKSTLALRAIRSSGVRMFSDDTPLIDRRGWLHPFPLRLGVNETDAASLPPGAVRRLERMEFHPKLALELNAVAGRIATAPQPLRHIVIGRRSLAGRARLERVPRRRAIGPLLREAVVGVGVYQGMEFVLQRGLRDVFAKAGDAGTRTACCAAGLRRAQVWSLTLGRDHDRNWAELTALLH